jgi:hypothetical protein
MNNKNTATFLLIIGEVAIQQLLTLAAEPLGMSKSAPSHQMYDWKHIQA